MAFDGEDLEIMTKGVKHEDFRVLLGRFVSELCTELSIAQKSLGETTWKRVALSRGIEADHSYYFSPQKLAAAAAAKAKGSDEIADYPNPDLAIEVDISPPLVDRPGIYAALKVPEVWRFDGEVLTIEWLGPNGQYAALESSRWLPVRPDQVVPWLVEEDATDETAWARRLRGWIRSELTKPEGAS
jgi:Uma2 family endonuclease